MDCIVEVKNEFDRPSHIYRFGCRSCSFDRFGRCVPQHCNRRLRFTAEVRLQALKLRRFLLGAPRMNEQKYDERHDAHAENDQRVLAYRIDDFVRMRS